MISMAILRKALKWSPEREDELEMLRDSVVELWEEVTGLKWNTRAAHEQTVVTSLNATSILLELLPVGTIASVYEKNKGDSSWVLVDEDAYELIGRRTLERIDGDIWLDYVKVTYAGGTDDADAIIKRALIAQVKFESTRLDGEDQAVESKSVGKSTTKLLRPDLHPFFRKVARQKGRKA